MAIGPSSVRRFMAFSGEMSVHETRISDSESVGQYFQWAQKLSLGRQFSLPPAFALLAVPCLLFVTMALMVMFQPHHSKGLYVRLLKPDQAPLSENPLLHPIIVQVVDTGGRAPPAIYVNSKSTTWNNLASDLRDQLKLRPEWVVYVNADPNLAWAYVANVVDVAKGLHARVVLVTSSPTLNTHKVLKYRGGRRPH
jgi:biopolymer transport protein ExbD